MTTVAFKDGVMACDSCFSYGGSVDTLSGKIVRLRSGALVGQAGANDARDVIALLNDVKTPRGLPSWSVLSELRSEFFGLLVFQNKRIFKIALTMVTKENWTPDFVASEDLGIWEIDFPFTAIGTGAELAVGAMEAGADAVKAVRIACRRDMNSRLPVHAVKLKEF